MDTTSSWRRTCAPTATTSLLAQLQKMKSDIVQIAATNSVRLNNRMTAISTMFVAEVQDTMTIGTSTDDRLSAIRTICLPRNSGKILVTGVTKSRKVFRHNKPSVSLNLSNFANLIFSQGGGVVNKSMFFFNKNPID